MRNELWRSECGQGLTEYLILMILVAVTSIAMVSSMGTQIRLKMQTIRDQIQNVKVERD